MGYVIPFGDHPAIPQLDARKWKSFAVAYIDEFGNKQCIVYAENVCQGKNLLRTALIQLEKTRRK